nr:hypothetical protein [Tanacetum cinerariifolium]
MESIFATASSPVAPLQTSLLIMTPSTISIITSISHAPIPPTTIPSEVFQNLPTFDLVFRYDERLKSLEASFFEYSQTNPFAEAVSNILDRLRDSYQRENDEFLRTIDDNMKRIIKEQVKSQVKEQVSKILPRIKQSVNAQLKAEVLTRSSHSSRTSYAVTADLSEMELKKILIKKMEGNKSIQCSNEQRNRRRNDDDDQGEGPSAGSDRGSKRQRKGKEPELASASLEPATRSAGRSTTGSKSRQALASESAFIEEPVQTTSQIEEPSQLVFDTDRDWNKTLLAAQGSTQTWISELAKQADSRSFFNELLDTPLDFSNFIMNRLRVDTLTPKLLAGPTYELIKGSCNSLTELEYHLEEVYKATTNQLDWVNPEDLVPRTLWIQEPINYDNHALWGVSHWGRKRQQFYGFAVNRESALDVYSKKRIIAITDLKIVEWHNYKHLDWILLSNLTVEERFAFNVSLRMFTRSIVIQRRVEDLQLGIKSYQKRLNLTKPDTYRSDLKRREAYSAYSNPRGFIYQNKYKKNRLMRIDELQKFSDATLNDVCNALDDHLKGIRMQYLPQTI